MRSTITVRTLVSALILGFLSGAMPGAHGAGTVTSPSEAALAAALQGGGVVNLQFNGTITLTRTISISAATSLEATGHQVVLSGRHALQAMTVASGASLTLRNLTIASGQVRGADGAVASDGTVQDADAGMGGALANMGGSVTLVNVAFIGNVATGGAGAFMEAADPSSGPSIYGSGGGGLGGAIYNSGGSVNLTSCSFSGNAAQGGDGGPGGTGRGGAVYSDGGSVIAVDCTFSGNAAMGGTGLDGDYSEGLPGGPASGGALDNSGGALTVTRSTLSGNSATGGPGGGGSFHHGGYNGATGGSAFGGAVHTEAGGPGHGALTISSSTFALNAAVGAVGGLASGFTAGEPGGNMSGAGGDGNGGGIGAGMIDTTGGTVSLTNCTLSRNSAVGGDGINDGSNTGGDAGNAAGGGLIVGGGTAVCTNCTFAESRAAAGVAQSNSGDFGSNSSGAPGTASGGNVRASGASIKLQNTIVAYGGAAGNTTGTIVDGGHNLSSDNTPRFGASSFNNTNPLLGPLANNGGPTLTRGLYVGSPAVDHASALLCPPTDQRGVARPQGAGCDIGAFEGTISDTVPPTVTITRPANRAVVRGFSSLLGTATDTGGVAHVDLVLQRRSDNKYWNGTAWTAGAFFLGTTILTTLPGQPWIRDISLGIPTGINLLNGLYALQATAFDHAGNKRSSTVTFTVDKTEPASVTITSPANATAVTNLTSMRGQATDNPGGSGIKHVDLILQRLSDTKYWTGSTWGTVSTVLTTVVTGTSWQRATGNPAGPNLVATRYELVARAYDQAENVIRTLSVFTVATTAHSLGGLPSAVQLSTCLVRADTDTVLLRFTGPLDAETAREPQHYTVSVNGQPVAVESAAYNATTHTVIIGLKAGELRPGDRVQVEWNGTVPGG